MGRHTEIYDIPEAYRVQRTESFEFRHAKSKEKNKKPKSPLWARLCVIFGAILLVMASLAYGGKLWIDSRYENNIKRTDLLGENRRNTNNGSNIKFPLNFLIIGSDERTADDYDPNDPSSRTASVKGERSDTIMLVHIPADKQKAYVISIPRDTDVQIPPSADGKFKGGKDKINAAYFYGGAPLLVSTIKNLMGVTVDYPIIVHFKAVRDLTDAVGGVDVVIDKQVQDPRTKITFNAGPQHLDGKTAEAYVRQRYGLPNGDYDRQKRQQQFIYALMNKITQTSVLANPLKLDKLLRIATSNLTVDNSMPKVEDLVLALKNLSPSDGVFMGLQMLPSRKINGVSYEFADETIAKQLGQAINNDTIPDYLTQYPPNNVTSGR